MFISKAEKEDLFYRIAVLEQAILGIKASLAYKPATNTRKGREWSPEQRAIASANMKARHAKEKAQKEKV
jgi:hypothetical protein